MTSRKTNPDTPEPETSAAPAEEAPVEPDHSKVDRDADRYEPYPGHEFFHGGRNSPIISAMSVRLYQEDCVDHRLGPDWTRAHQRAFAAWQKTLRPKEGGDVSGIPDESAWDRLKVPRVSPKEG